MLEFFELVPIETRKQIAELPRDERGFFIYPISQNPEETCCLLSAYIRLTCPDEWGVYASRLCAPGIATYCLLDIGQKDIYFPKEPVSAQLEERLAELYRLASDVTETFDRNRESLNIHEALGV